MERYVIISYQQYTANDLSAIKQRPYEKPGNYITRFNNEYAQCEGCDEAMTYNTLMGRLQWGDFYFSLTRKPPETYKYLIREATSYSRAEQLNTAQKATDGLTSETHPRVRLRKIGLMNTPTKGHQS